jgi:hypothetical protein
VEGAEKRFFCWACSHGTFFVRVHMEPFFVRVHMEPFLGFCDSFDHYLQSLLPGVRRASGTAPAGLSSDMLPGYFRVTDEEFSLLFLFVCVNLSPVNLLQGGSRPPSQLFYL